MHSVGPGTQKTMCHTREVAHANIGGPGTKTLFAILEKWHMHPDGQVPKRSSNILEKYTVKKRLVFFPSPAGMPLTKLSLAGNYLTILGDGEFG